LPVSNLCSIFALWGWIDLLHNISPMDQERSNHGKSQFPPRYPLSSSAFPQTLLAGNLRRTGVLSIRFAVNAFRVASEYPRPHRCDENR